MASENNTVETTDDPEKNIYFVVSSFKHIDNTVPWLILQKELGELKSIDDIHNV